MPIARESDKTFTPVSAGTHIARAFGVISLGTQPQDNPKFLPHFKVMLNWEIPGETIDMDGKLMPMVIGKEYTLSLGEKSNLRRDLEAWRGKPFTPDELKGFDVANVVGSACMLTVIHKVDGAKTYARVQAVAGIPKGIICPPAVHSPVVYEIEDGKDDVFNSLAEWIQRKIGQCEEWTHPVESLSVDDKADLEAEEQEGDDVPF